MYSAVAIANFFVRQAAKDGVRDLSPAKLHALVYFAHGWRLGVIGRSMVNGGVKAHRDGVFVPELREAGCWGTKRVEGLIAVVKLDETRGLMTEQTPELAADDPALASLEWVWKTYGRVPPFELARMTKEVGAPWDLIWNDEERPDDEPKTIPTGTVRLWFRELSARRRRESQQQALSGAQQRESAPALEETQQLLEQPNPDRLRSI